MPRKVLRPRLKRALPKPDSKFSSVLVSRFINKLNFKGKKSIAETILYKSFDIIQNKFGKDPFVIFNTAIENIRPLIEVRPRRVGGATYQIPMEVPIVRSTTLAITWLIKIARNKSGHSMCEKLAQEIIDSSNKEGSTIKKRDEVHRMAESNKAFAHYRW
ncbi:MAG: 30S ribosomal protein S7 [Endomicrobium sp.]|jgi:small subunit ribosomal protein S7|nr:30S ribosomal protein S7 [Endomicrobium sp.]